MPEIPTYQSRNPGPVGAEGQLSNPGVVGGNEITQGFSNLSSGLLVYAHAQAQQDAIDAATAASQHLSAVVNEADQLWSDIQDAQIENFGDPRERRKTYQQALNNKIQDHLDSPDLQTPSARKYFTTHVPAMLESRLKTVHTETQSQLQRWNLSRVDDNLTQLSDAAINDPAARSESTKQAKALITATALLNPNYNYPKEWQAWQDNVAQQRGRAIVGADSQGFINAQFSGQLPKYFADQDMNWDHFSSPVQKELTTLAHEQNTLRIANDTAERTESERRIKDYQTMAKNRYLSRHIPHQDEMSGQMMQPEPVEKILADLGTLNSKAMLGDTWDEVHSFYVTALNHEKSGEGGTPAPEQWNKVLEGIYTGRLADEMSVLKESTGLGFSVKWRNTALEKFNTQRGHIETSTQQRVRQGLDVIAGRFKLPGGAAIDPANAIGNQSMVEQRFFLWLEGVKATGDRNLTNADIIGTAQKIADEQFANMQGNVINIIPQTEASLYYKTPAEVETAFKDHKITKHQADSFLQEIAQFERLQHIAETKPKAGGKGRGEAFK